MTCSEFMALLDDLLDDEVNAAMRAELNEHLSGCEHCFITMNTTRQTIELYTNRELYPLPESIVDRLHEAIMRRCGK